MLFIGLNKMAAVLALLIGGMSLPPESEQYKSNVLNDVELKSTELLSRYQHYNFSPLWLKTGKGIKNSDASVVGFIGNDYQRLRIKILTSQPDPHKPGCYLVTGKSKVRDNVTVFQGTFRLLHVREAIALPHGLDGAPVPAVKTGILLAEYELKEPANQLNSGIFRGVLRTNWYLDRKGVMRYDDVRACCLDGFNNNQFVGTWQSYTTKATKRCNWGDWRIPDGRQVGSAHMLDTQLDIGAGEFSPAKEYQAKGWQSYQDAQLLSDDRSSEESRAKKKALATEAAEWWK